MLSSPRQVIYGGLKVYPILLYATDLARRQNICEKPSGSMDCRRVDLDADGWNMEPQYRVVYSLPNALQAFTALVLATQVIVIVKGACQGDDCCPVASSKSGINLILNLLFGERVADALTGVKHGGGGRTQ